MLFPNVFCGEAFSMRSSRSLRPLQKTQRLWDLADSFVPNSYFGACCARSLTSSKRSPDPNHGHQRGKASKGKAKEPDPNLKPEKADHRLIGALRSLYTTDVSSPGTPFFLPRGTHIFQKLTSFLRAQYPMLGFREVLTPTIYKEELWRQSGHWDNYKDDMFMVEKGEKLTESYGLKPMNCPGHCILFRSKRRSYKELPIRYAEFSPLHRNEISGALSGLTRVRRFHQDDGHVFCRPSQVMDEVLKSIQFVKLVYGAMGFNIFDLSFVLSTRPKEGYIGEVEEWDRAEAQLKEALDRALIDDKSTMEQWDKMGTLLKEAADLREAQLKEALDCALNDDKLKLEQRDKLETLLNKAAVLRQSQLKGALDRALFDNNFKMEQRDRLETLLNEEANLTLNYIDKLQFKVEKDKTYKPWTVSEGDGAFYGPKIDVILRDSDGKQHQTATIQLDFQLPKRFQLEYEAPAPALEAKGLTTDDPVLMETMGRVAPVMIHRAVLGSLERFIALLLERDWGKLPLWLSPRQMIILTVTDKPQVVNEARNARNTLSNLIPASMARPRSLNEPTYIVDFDGSGDSIANKVARAKKLKYNLIGVMGLKNLTPKTTIDLEVNRDVQPALEKTWDHIEKIKPGSQAPIQKDKGIGGVSKGDGVRLEVEKLQKLMASLCDDYL